MSHYYFFNSYAMLLRYILCNNKKILNKGYAYSILNKTIKDIVKAVLRHNLQFDL